MDGRVDDPALLDVIAAAYESALDPTRWPALLDLLGATFRSTFTDVFARTQDRERWHGLASGMDGAEYCDVFLGTWTKRNIWGERRPVVMSGEVVTTREMMPWEELVRTDMFNDFLGPHGLHEGMRLSLWAGEGWVQYISLLRPRSAGPFEPHEVARARQLLPHLQRAAAVTRLMREAEPLAQLGLASLDSLHQAAFVLDSQGFPLRYNSRAKALLAVADGLILDANGLRAGNVPLWDQLRGLLAHVPGPAATHAGAAGKRATAGAGRLRVARPSGLAPLVLTAVPISSENDWSALSSPAILVLVEEPGISNLPTAADFARRFGLTAAEAELATHLASGQSLAEIAAQSGRSVTTLRTHLARLMAKTGVGRQAALVHLLLKPSAALIEATRPIFG